MKPFSSFTSSSFSFSSFSFPLPHPPSLSPVSLFLLLIRFLFFLFFLLLFLIFRFYSFSLPLNPLPPRWLSSFLFLLFLFLVADDWRASAFFLHFVLSLSSSLSPSPSICPSFSPSSSYSLIISILPFPLSSFYSLRLSPSSLRIISSCNPSSFFYFSSFYSFSRYQGAVVRITGATWTKKPETASLQRHTTSAPRPSRVLLLGLSSLPKPSLWPSTAEARQSSAMAISPSIDCNCGQQSPRAAGQSIYSARHDSRRCRSNHIQYSARLIIFSTVMTFWGVCVCGLSSARLEAQNGQPSFP